MGLSANSRANQWDTYVTIDTDTAEGDATTLSAGFAEETGNLRGFVKTFNAGWFVSPDDLPQGLALDCNGNGLPDECEDLPCLRADLDCNGGVNFSDLLRILIAWGPCEGCREDIDENGVVGFSDILIVLANHGTCE